MTKGRAGGDLHFFIRKFDKLVKSHFANDIEKKQTFYEAVKFYF
jgi:hypothetical protein